MHRRRHALALPVALALTAACWNKTPSKGGGQISEARAAEEAAKDPDPSGVQVPPGYRIEVVAEGLTFPTGVAFGDGGEIYVVESGYSTKDVEATPRVLEVSPDGRGAPRVVVAGDSHAPWNGIDSDGDVLYVAQGGQEEGGRVVRLTRDGAVEVLVDGLPSQGDHHTNGPAVGDDGYVYFGQGTVTNSGVVGEDSHLFGWLPKHPQLADVPCQDVELAGVNFESANPLTDDPDDRATTGPYLPFGAAATQGQIVKGQTKCSGAILRVRAEGGEPELVAWGFRNPYGMRFGGDGALYVVDNGFDERGSRPVFGSADMLWRVEADGEVRWYGWPDFTEGRPLTWDAYSEGNGETKGFVLASHPGEPPSPRAFFPVHSSADGIDFSTTDEFGYRGWAFVAQFGDMAPVVGKVVAPVGFNVVRVDPETGDIEEFARNDRDTTGPASRLGTSGLERPIAVRFDPTGTALYVVDFGVLRMTEKGPEPVPESGRLWRIRKVEP